MEPHPPPGYMARWPQGPMYRPQTYSETNDLKDDVREDVTNLKYLVIYFLSLILGK